MRVRWITFGALLLALVVSPSAARAMTHSLSGYACQPSTPQIGSGYRHGQRSPWNIADSFPGHNRPVPRLHRIRGKKISIERGFAVAQARAAQGRYLFSISPTRQQNPDGPNPSRGPPSPTAL